MFGPRQSLPVTFAFELKFGRFTRCQDNIYWVSYESGETP